MQHSDDIVCKKPYARERGPSPELNKQHTVFPCRRVKMNISDAAR